MTTHPLFSAIKSSDAQRPVGRLNWIFGFSPRSSRLSIRCSFSPVIRCFATSPASKLTCERTAVLAQIVEYDIPLAKLRTLRLGGCYHLDDFSDALGAHQDDAIVENLEIEVSADDALLTSGTNDLPEVVSRALEAYCVDSKM